MLMDPLPINMTVCAKGGTGKTFTAVMLVDQYLAAGHDRVLCIETDVQNQDMARVMSNRGRDDVTVMRANLARSAGWARMRDAVGRHSGPVVIDTPAASQTSFDEAVNKGWVDDFLRVRRMRTWFTLTRDAITLEHIWRYLLTMPPHDVVTVLNAQAEGPVHIAGARRPVTVRDGYMDLLAANPEPACAQVLTALQRHCVTEVMIPYLHPRAAEMIAGQRLDFAAAEAALVGQLAVATTRLSADQTDEVRDHHERCDRALAAMRQWRETMRERCWPIIAPDARAVGGVDDGSMRVERDPGETLGAMMPVGTVSVAVRPPSAPVQALFGPVPGVAAVLAISTPPTHMAPEMDRGEPGARLVDARLRGAPDRRGGIQGTARVQGRRGALTMEREATPHTEIILAMERIQALAEAVEDAGATPAAVMYARYREPTSPVITFGNRALLEGFAITTATDHLVHARQAGALALHGHTTTAIGGRIPAKGTLAGAAFTDAAIERCLTILDDLGSIYVAAPAEDANFVLVAIHDDEATVHHVTTGTVLLAELERLLRSVRLRAELGSRHSTEPAPAPHAGDGA